MDWQSIPVRQIPLARFVIPLHNISVPHLRTDHTGDAVWAFSRWPDEGDVWVSDGRHRVLRALLRGDTHIELTGYPVDPITLSRWCPHLSDED